MSHEIQRPEEDHWFSVLTEDIEQVDPQTFLWYNVSYSPAGKE